MSIYSRRRVILSAAFMAAFMLLSQSAQAGHQLSAGDTLWMRTSLPAPSHYPRMTFFWTPIVTERVTGEYVVYRPDGKYGQVLHPLGMDMEPFQGDSVIVSFHVLEGSMEFPDTVWVWDGGRPGGMQAWAPYPFYFGFYEGPYPTPVIGYVPGEILAVEPAHGDAIVVYPLRIAPGQPRFRSDFVEAAEVPLDIKPLSCPNPVNTVSRGRIPVGLLGTAGFDVRTVNIETLRLEGVAPLKIEYADVSAPFDPGGGPPSCGQCAILGPDGYEDLVMHFDTQAIAEYVNGSGTAECRVLVLAGEKTDGTRFVARDVVKIVR